MPMITIRNRITNLAVAALCALGVGIIVAAVAPVFAAGVDQSGLAPANDPLVQLARAGFANLTPCELNVLHAAASGGFSSCAVGIRKDQDVDESDPLNDPSKGATWSPDRTVRAALLRWLFFDRQALKYLYPTGVQIRGARIPDYLDLHNFTIPVELRISYCYLPHGMDLRGAKISELHVRDSYSGPLRLASITVTHDLDIYADTIAAGNEPVYRGLIDLSDAQIGGVLTLDDSRVMYGGAPGATSVSAMRLHAKDGVSLSDFRADGIVNLIGSTINADLAVNDSKFVGPNLNGLLAWGATVTGRLWWTGITTTPRTFFDLTDAKVGSLTDDQASWPSQNNLSIDGFVYNRLDCPENVRDLDCAVDAATRLKWLGLQSSNRYFPQPYRQLASILTARGDMGGARTVLIAAQNQEMHAGDLSVMQRVWGWLLWATIDYGYESTWALLWAAIVTIIGGVIVRMAHEAGVMKPAQPERKVAAPMAYSIDLFVPIVDLRLQRNCWPDPTAHGTATFLGRKISVSGSAVRAYLWFQIVAGYMLTGLFVAGLSGLVHNR